MSMTRRSFALAAVGGAVLPALPAAAKAPAAGAQAAGIYRVKVGTIEVTVLNDGSAALPTKFFSGDPAGIPKLMEAAFTPGEIAGIQRMHNPGKAVLDGVSRAGKYGR
jgi:hypothetical protein